MKASLRIILARRPPLHVITGPAGSGKTHEVCMAARNAVRTGEVRRIVVTRPIVTVNDEQLGFLPGTVSSKMDPYMSPVLQFLDRSMIHVMPIGFMRGMTLGPDTWVIADEAQNMTMDQIRCVLTRIGQGSNICMTGDLDQVDLEGSGFGTLVEKIKETSPHFAELTELGPDDVIRHEAIPEFLDLCRDPPDSGHGQV
jgi:phosphate starvation-inducible PhoH-like protein